MADVAEPPGPVGVRASGPVVAGTQFTAVADRTGASGLGRSETGEPFVVETRIQTEIAVAVAGGPAVTGAGDSVGVETGLRPVGKIAEAGGPAGTRAGSPVMVGNRFLAVADVHALFENREDDPPSDLGKFQLVPGTITKVTHPQPLRHADVMKEVTLKNESGSGTQNTDSEVIGEVSDSDQVGFPFLHRSPCGENSLWDANGAEDTTEGEAIMVGAVGSAAPWFLMGWTNDVEVEFMIDTGCQVTILATSVFKRMCEVHPQLQRLVSADSSPLLVSDVMCCVVASIGSDGLLGTEALQLCLPHQLDLRTGQLWADGRSTLQLHQQKPTPTVSGSLITVVVLPPDSEVVANFSIDGGQLGTCALINPNRDLTEEFGVIVGHTLVDATMPSANVLIINPNAEEVVLPCGAHIGDLVPVLVVSVARSDLQRPIKRTAVLPDYLDDIIQGSHPSLGDTGRQSLRDLLHRYEHVFPAPGEPVTGRSKSVQHEIETNEGRPVRCGPRRLAPAGLRREQDCVKEMLTAGQIEPSDSPWASPVVLVTKKDGSTRFCVDYRRLNAMTIKDAYPLPRIDDSLRLLGNQQWFSTMDLASGYWQVAMSPEAKRKAAFVTNEGLFQFRVMPFGLCNAPGYVRTTYGPCVVWHEVVPLPRVFG